VKTLAKAATSTTHFHHTSVVMPNQLDQALKITSESHSWLIHGCPWRVNDHGSVKWSVRVSQIQRPDARCHHRSDPIMVVNPKDQNASSAASSHSNATAFGSVSGAATTGAGTGFAGRT